jgi:hypothetical protein
MKSFSSILVKLVLLGLILSPFLCLYWFLTDPVNCIANLIGAWLWLVIVILPLTLLIVILWGIFSLVLSIFSDIVNLFK